MMSDDPTNFEILVELQPVQEVMGKRTVGAKCTKYNFYFNLRAPNDNSFFFFNL